MARGPQDDPLGAKPVLPPPTAAGAKRAATLFRQLIDMQRDDEPAGSRRQAAAASPEPSAPEPAPPAVEGFGGGRRYDQALAVVAAIADLDHGAPEILPDEETPPPTVDPFPLDETVADSDFDAHGELTAAPVTAPGEDGAAPVFPPIGAPTVRPSVPAPAAAVPADGAQGLLSETATGAMVIEEPDGGLSFDVEFKDEVFQDLACRITTKDGVVTAVFRVQDPNTRRLLEAEAGRLRVQLESKGLKVQEIRVEVVG